MTSAKPKLPGAEAGLLPRDTFLAAAKDYFTLLTRPLIEARTAQTRGKAFAAHYTRMVDTIVGVLFQRAAEENGLASDATDIAVIAMGGYGRAELAPYSDVDVLVACSRKTPAVEAVAGAFIRLMWDFGFELGHAVESLVESETALAQDLDTKTALIESRWVCGSRRVAKRLERQIARIRRRERQEYLRRKVRDALARYEKYGRSFQLIEPNVKLSPGGMRDYQTLVWLGQVAARTRGLSALHKKRLLLRGEQRELEEAYEFLLRTRVELHLATRSKQDQLTVAAQRKIAEGLGFRARGGHLAVESFMRAYYQHTRAIFRITVDVLEALGQGENVAALLGDAPITRDGDTMNLSLRGRVIDARPLYVFERQKEAGKRLDRALRRRLEVVLRTRLKGAAALNRMRRAFVALLDDDRHLALVVRSLHETLFLERIIPEYEQLTCLKRYDLYHAYTVDEHSFKVLEHITALGDEGADPADPLVRLYSELPDRRVLFVTALLHDVGKIEGRGHAKKGAALARKILARLFLDDETTARVCHLIEHHLLMSHFSQRRDGSDLGTITAFCDRVGERTNLKYLCLLTYADYQATSPQVWNEWKRTLLWELYARAYDFMARREKQPEEVYQSHKRALLDAFAAGAERDAALAHLDLLPGGYLLTMSAEMVREHLHMVARLDGEPFLVTHGREGAAHQFTFCTHDKPYRLSQLCGALTLNDFNILYARVFTRRDGKVIDVFYVEDVSAARAAGARDMEARVQSVQRDLAAILAGTLDLEAATRRHAERWRRKAGPRMDHAVEVRFENDLSIDHTIIDVFAADRPGLLYKITRALSTQDLTITRANISTEATRAIDSFYVGDAEGRKVTDASALTRIRSALEGEVG
ncbi:MAG: [protein-PII] uridylyltransferase [Candidatus Krumholzibacteria bacterium]|nr:[protein-PII] uridylyltransferase [Candidatus Krumholzibacteria bacterium]